MTITYLSDAKEYIIAHVIVPSGGMEVTPYSSHFHPRYFRGEDSESGRNERQQTMNMQMPRLALTSRYGSAVKPRDRAQIGAGVLSAAKARRLAPDRPHDTAQTEIN
ncbi:hypothetical protein J6590_010929 [Homalodisca vitripennis]|nr:hypothetical protein J6590_010929 [Homalodisca vitripennis]